MIFIIQTSWPLHPSKKKKSALAVTANLLEELRWLSGEFESVRERFVSKGGKGH